MIIHVLLCICFWHCEAIAANSKASSTPLPGAGFCKVGYRQSWPGESSSNSIKNIDTTHFWSQVPVINNYLTSLLVFTLSFFNQQAYGKLNACMAAAGQATGALNNISFFCLAQIPDRVKARNFMRLLHAYHHLAYMEFGAKIANPRSWQMLQDRHLLSAEECAYLKDSKRVGSAKTMHVLSWAVQWLSREVKEGRIPPPNANIVYADLMSLRGGCGGLKGQTENPIPFGYMFAVNMLLYCVRAPVTSLCRVSSARAYLRASSCTPRQHCADALSILHPQWAVSVGLFFAGFLSVYGSVAYALVVYIFFSARPRYGCRSLSARADASVHRPAPHRHSAVRALRLRDAPPAGARVPDARLHLAPRAAGRRGAAHRARLHEPRGHGRLARLLRPLRGCVRQGVHHLHEDGRGDEAADVCARALRVRASVAALLVRLFITLLAGSRASPPRTATRARRRPPSKSTRASDATKNDDANHTQLLLSSP